MSKPEDELEPVDSLPAVIGDFSQDSKLSPPNGNINSGATVSCIRVCYIHISSTLRI